MRLEMNEKKFSNVKEHKTIIWCRERMTSYLILYDGFVPYMIKIYY